MPETNNTQTNSLASLLALMWQYYFAVQFALTLLLFYPYLWWCFRSPQRYHLALRLQRHWSGYLLKATGIRIKIMGNLPNPDEGPFVFTPNHRNFLDILLMYFVARGPFHFMAKAELARIPLFRILFSKTHIPFNRSNASDSSLAFRRGLSELRNDISLVVFPEATQNPREDCLLPFKDGAFKLAEEAGVPVVGVYFENNLERLPHSRDLFRLPGRGGPGEVRIHIMPPVLGSAEFTRRHVRSTMEDWMQEFSN